ncbi:MAG TPA: beta-L-arabinofuranosidase domain-containing protein [Bryobacteraceae bacterium]|nr:beta-L-arabinofuranosidase domain-containing protein [Bryobacteraceae bacterium]
MSKPDEPVSGMDRRDFLKAAPLAAAAGLVVDSLAAPAVTRNIIEAFDYRGVHLRESRWRRQVLAAREFYLSLSDDDILHGFRRDAGLAGPGKPLGGWCKDNSSTVLGQWLSGMARLSRVTGDSELREKAGRLLSGWGKTVKPDGDCRMRHYAFDKMVCGLVDMDQYTAHPEALPLLEKTTAWARRSFEHENMVVVPAHNTMYYGLPQEWYTLAENLYRAYRLTGNPDFRSFAEIWHYPAYWGKFRDTAAPRGAQGVHAYSHVNTFSSAAMAYAVTGDPDYLHLIRNAYEYLQNTQCYATGGYGPNERFMTPGGSLGKALEARSDTFETICGSWAGFKLSRYLMQFTGISRYGDWIERLFYNGVGASLPLRPGGRNFYYSDYRISGGMKVDYWENFTCCSGTYLQNMADYHNLIYYREEGGLYVNLYVPSEVTWRRKAIDVRIVQETGYPETETSTLTVDVAQSVDFALKLRVPGWSRDMSVKLNGVDAGVTCDPGNWAIIMRTWNPGDRVEVRIPLALRTEAVDRQHPDRVAVVRGPVVMTLDYNYHDPNFELPKRDRDLNRWLVADESPSVFRVQRPDERPVRLKFRPFYEQPEDFPYLMYFDRGAAPYALW